MGSRSAITSRARGEEKAGKRWRGKENEKKEEERKLKKRYQDEGLSLSVRPAWDPGEGGHGERESPRKISQEQ